MTTTPWLLGDGIAKLAGAGEDLNGELDLHTGETLWVLLQDPVQLEPPPPLAPPTTNPFHGRLLLLIPSGVPAWSPLFCQQAV